MTVQAAGILFTPRLQTTKGTQLDWQIYRISIGTPHITSWASLLWESGEGGVTWGPDADPPNKVPLIGLARGLPRTGEAPATALAANFRRGDPGGVLVRDPVRTADATLRHVTTSTCHRREGFGTGNVQIQGVQ